MPQKNLTSLLKAFILVFTFSFYLTYFKASSAVVEDHYWVLFGAPGKPASDWNTAEELLEKLSSNGIAATEINRFKNSGWDGHIKDFPFNDFEISATEGYLVKVNSSDPDFEDIFTDYEEIIPSEYSISVGWTLINFPKGFKDAYSITTAEEVCQNIGDKLEEISYTDPYQNENKPIDEISTYKSHECGSDDNNFEIKDAHAYYLKSSDYISWEPQEVKTSYFVFWGPKGVPSDSWNRAEELLDKLNDEDIDAVSISKWENSGWLSHIHDFPFNDFSIKEGDGYEIEVDDYNAKLNDVLDSWGDVSSVTYNLVSSWNLISFPKGLLEGNANLSKASDLCDYSGVTEIQYTKYFEKGTDPDYTNYECNQNDDDFSLESGIGYFVKSNKNSTFTLTKTTASSNSNNDDNNDTNSNNEKESDNKNTTSKDKTADLMMQKAPSVSQPIAAAKILAEPIGQILGVDFSTLNYYDSMFILLAFILLIFLVIFLLVLAIYRSRRLGEMPSIRAYFKSIFTKKSQTETADSKSSPEEK